MEAAGSFVVSWERLYGSGAFARRFDAAGVSQATEFKIDQDPFIQGAPALAFDGRGDFVAAWPNDGADGDGYGIFARRFDQDNAGDVDGNGAIDPLTDGLLVLRYLFGFRGAALIVGVVAPDCTRCTAPAIEAFIAAKV
jgi:hypothetical protein